MAWVRAQMAFGNRIPGSEAHRRTGDWIVEQLRSRADTVIVQSWTHTTADGKALPMRNVLARFRPDAAERVLYVAHWDTRPISDQAPPPENKLPVPGANDGASGVALLIGVADALKRTPPTYGVDLLLVDGEDYGDFTKGKDVFIGSRYFADHLPSTDYRPLFGVVWDMIGDRDLQIYHEGNSVAFAPEVVARVWQEAEDLGYSRFFVQQARHTIDDDHIPLQRKGLRVIDVIDFDFPHHHRPTDTVDKVSAKSMQIVGDVAVGLVTTK
ncbi:MAG TPA: M28 family peptidase [Gemmatimonadaceae bacterium]|nr:M28 family peptidase [Gemmatimonadaceae bacterium]